MRKLLLGGLILFFIGASAGLQAFTYAVDDGTRDTSLGTSQGSDLFWLNAFTAVPGETIIASIDVAWGSSAAQDTTVMLLLYDDPNNDGDPDDAVLLTTTTTVALDLSGNYVSHPIPLTQVSGGFFVAAFIEDAPSGAVFLAAIDTSPSLDASWSNAGSNIADVTNLSGLLSPIEFCCNPPLDGNFMLRATSQGRPAVAIPTLSRTGLAIMLFLIASMAVMMRRRLGVLPLRH